MMVVMASRLGLRLLFCAPDLAKQRTSQARGTPSWAALLLQESALLCEHNSRVLPQMEHPCEHTIGARFYLPSLSTVWFAIFFHVFCIVGKKFPVAYPCRCLFFSVFFGNRLHLTAHFPVKNFMLASLSLYLLACFSVIFVLC